MTRKTHFDASNSRRATGLAQSGNAEIEPGRMLISLSGNPYAGKNALRGKGMLQGTGGKAVPRVGA